MQLPRTLPALAAVLSRDRGGPDPHWIRRRLRRVLRSAATAPYYRDLFRRRGLDPDAVTGPESLAGLPVTTNVALRALPVAARLAAGRSPEGLLRRRSSGSTGVPFDTYLTRHERELHALYALRAFLAGGYRPTDVLLDLTEPSPPPSRPVERLGLFRKRYVPATEPLEAHLEELLARPPQALLTTGTLLEVLTEALAARGRRLPLRAVFTVGERLTARQRRLAREFFGVDPVDTYGATEVGPIAFQCPQRRGYHVHTDSVLVELLDPDAGNPVPPGVTGQVVLTSLVNEAMPLVRYSVGDLARWSAAPCPCGRRLPLLEAVEGRLIERLYDTRGRRVSPWGPTIELEETPGVQRYQLVQDAPGRLRVRLEGEAVDEEDLTRRLGRHLGSDLRVEVEYCRRLAPRGAKFRLVVCRVPD